MKTLATLALILFVLSSVVTGWAIYVRNAENGRVWHVVLCDIEGQTLADKTLSAQEKARAVKFYDGLLVNDIHVAPCDFTRR